MAHFRRFILHLENALIVRRIKCVQVLNTKGKHCQPMRQHVVIQIGHTRPNLNPRGNTQRIRQIRHKSSRARVYMNGAQQRICDRCGRIFQNKGPHTMAPGICEKLRTGFFIVAKCHRACLL